MKKCNECAFENCPPEERCNTLAEAFFMRGSECERFNNAVIAEMENGK